MGTLIFYAGGEYKILQRQFFDGNTPQNSFFNIIKCIFFFFFFFFFFLRVCFLCVCVFFFFFFFFFIRSELVGLKIFRSNSQASMIFITYTLLKCLLKCLPDKTMQLILYDDSHFTCSVKVRAISFV